MDKNTFTISWGALWKILFMLALATLIFLSLKILAAFLLAIVISSALDPAVTWFAKKGIPRLISTLLVFIVFGGILGFLLYTLIPLAVVESNNLVQNLGGLTTKIFSLAPQNIDFLQFNTSDITNITKLVSAGGNSFLGTASTLLGGIALLMATFVISFYLTVSQDGVERFLRSILPDVYEEPVLTVYSKIRRRIGRWLQIQLFLSLMIGVTVFIGLSILGIKYALVLGIVAAIFELVPIIGPIFAGAVAVLVAFSQSFILALYTFLMFFVIQQLESNVIMPVVMKRAIGLHPVVVILALLIGAEIAGISGVVLAVPAAFLAEEVIEDLATRRKKK